MIEDFFLDKLGGNKSSIHTIGLEKINEIKNKHNLIDIWRKTNPTKKIFTYHNPDKTIHTRLDRIYTSKKIKITTSKIQPTSLSDHDSVSVTFQISEENPRGSGIWKMNTSILQQNQFKEIFQNFWNYWQNEKIKFKNHNSWWDAGKIYLKAITIDFCTRKNKQINKKQQDLISYITQEKSKISPNIEKINKLQQELDDIENYKTEGTIIRSKEKVILNEEKPTKYFYAQEKQKQTKKNITTLIDEQGNTLQKTLRSSTNVKIFTRNFIQTTKHVLTHKNNYSNKLNQKLLNCKTKNLQNKYK